MCTSINVLSLLNCMLILCLYNHYSHFAYSVNSLWILSVVMSIPLFLASGILPDVMHDLFKSGPETETRTQHAYLSPCLYCSLVVECAHIFPKLTAYLRSPIEDMKYKRLCYIIVVFTSYARQLKSYRSAFISADQTSLYPDY